MTLGENPGENSPSFQTSVAAGNRPYALRALMWRKIGAMRVSATIGSASATSTDAMGSPKASIVSPASTIIDTHVDRVR